MSEKQDRQGVRTASELERKYQFDKRFAEIMGMATDAQKSVTELESTLKHEILEQYTSLTRTTETIIMSALLAYVETEDMEEFKKTLRTDFEIWAGGITGRVEAAEEGIQKAEGDIQSLTNTIVKYFTFDINGLTIGQENNPNKVVIDNDDITIYVGNREVVTFKADGSGLIPRLTITEQLNVLGLNMTEDDTNINIDYVGV